MPGIVTLLTDFGSSSPYPAEMKAVLASSCEAVLIDITHDVPRHDVRAGAYLLAAVARTTPAGKVHPAGRDAGGGDEHSAAPRRLHRPGAYLGRLGRAAVGGQVRRTARAGCVHFSRGSAQR